MAALFSRSTVDRYEPSGCERFEHVGSVDRPHVGRESGINDPLSRPLRSGRRRFISQQIAERYFGHPVGNPVSSGPGDSARSEVRQVAR